MVFKSHMAMENVSKKKKNLKQSYNHSLCLILPVIFITHGSIGSILFFFFLSSPEDIFPYFVQIEWEGERGRRERERNIDVKGHIEWLPPTRPTRAGDKLQPKYVSLVGTEPGSLRTAGRRSNR
uniref:Uncharacterized protein n=1 Tax=Molossus molossus TaxID=27622 RepID=A0A7J8J018_MOLMO|nr:hypothetical protein HJG59_010263 [Molossus molossus]